MLPLVPQNRHHYKAMVMNIVKGGKFECWVEIL